MEASLGVTIGSTMATPKPFADGLVPSLLCMLCRSVMPLRVLLIVPFHVLAPGSCLNRLTGSAVHLAPNHLLW